VGIWDSCCYGLEAGEVEGRVGSVIDRAGRA
jgi:hypothetical protein